MIPYKEHFMIAYAPSYAGRRAAAHVRVLLRILLRISCNCGSTGGRLRARELLTFVTNILVGEVFCILSLQQLTSRYSLRHHWSLRDP